MSGRSRGSLKSSLDFCKAETKDFLIAILVLGCVGIEDILIALSFVGRVQIECIYTAEDIKISVLALGRVGTGDI